MRGSRAGWPTRPLPTPLSLSGCPLPARPLAVLLRRDPQGGAAGTGIPAAPVSPRSANLREVLIVVRRNVTGEQLAQVDNQDPFASPVWRSPVYRTPEFVIWIVQLARLLWRVLWFVIRHPGLDVTAGILLLLWASTGWQGLVTSAGIVLTILIAFRLPNPRWFTRLIFFKQKTAYEITR